MRMILCLATICIICSGHAEINEGARITPGDQMHHDLPKSINEFGYKLLIQMMKQNNDNNVVISPISIAGLLAMTLLGSVGRTYDELVATLGFSQDILENRINHEQFGELLHSLNANDTFSKTLYADGIFVDPRTKLREVYRSYLNRVYHGSAMNANFQQSTEVKLMINEWVKSHTNGKIDNFLKQPLPESTEVVLLTALYFYGQWAHPFLPEYTKRMPFRKPSGNVTAELMLNLGEFDYLFSEEDGLHMIALPYNDSITTMYVLKPRIPKRLSLIDLLDSLSYAKIDDLINQMSQKKCVVRFPKIDLQSNVNLEKPLKALGIKTLFIPGEANFALMIDNNEIANKTDDELILRINNRAGGTRGLKEMVDNLPNPGVHVDSVIHDIRMIINEFGTEAVAATSGILARSAEQFHADSPFYMFIRNERTKLVTFSAAIFDPTL